MQKLFLLVVLFSSISILTEAQRNSFGLTIGTGNGFIAQQALDGIPGLELNRSFSIGIQYNRIFNDRYIFKTGLTGYKNQISVTPAFYPGVDMTPSKKIIMAINPYMNLHGMILTDKENYPERIVDSGIKVGIRTK